MSKTCNYAGGCRREATRPFPAEPVQGWLCDEHFGEVLNAAADVEAAARQQLDAEWHAHLEQYFREHNLDLLNPAGLTEIQTQQLRNDAERWFSQKRGTNKSNKSSE